MIPSKDEPTKRHARRMATRRERNEKGLCAYCGVNPKLEDRIGCGDCSRRHSYLAGNFSRDRKDRTALYRKRIRRKIIDKYGGCCACCGKRELLFLTIDHKDGKGFEDRKSYTGTSWYMYLLRTDLRTDLQVLCYNCNNGREMGGGICPHHNPTSDDLWETPDLRTLRRFNAGNKYSWPTDDELLNLYRTLGPTRAGQQLTVPADMVIKRLQTRGLIQKRTR